MAVTVEKAREIGKAYMERKLKEALDFAESRIDAHLNQYGCNSKGMAWVDFHTSPQAEKELVRIYAAAGWKLKFKWRREKSGSYSYKKRSAVLKAAR